MRKNNARPKSETFGKNKKSVSPRFQKKRRLTQGQSEEGGTAKSRNRKRKTPKFQTPKQNKPNYDTNRIQKARTNKRSKSRQEETLIRLNRFIANAGVCSRREADELIKAGLISVNGEVMTELGYKVKPSDTIKYRNRVLKRQSFVYLILNKPKDFITTLDDPENRKTVMQLVKNACQERIYPVGRLDRDTTGLLLFTNDGNLAQKLSHPSHEIRKIYQVDIDSPITKQDLQQITEGISLEDGLVHVDQLAILNKEKTSLGVEIHVGKNRIIRRIFEHFGYKVTKLDRTMYAGLTKKDMPRGQWRFLTEKEVIRLKHFI